MCDRCKARLRNSSGGFTDRLSQLKINDFDQLDDTSSNSDFYIRLNSPIGTSLDGSDGSDGSDGFHSGTMSSSASPSGTGTGDANCTSGSGCSKHSSGLGTGSGSTGNGSANKTSSGTGRNNHGDLNYRVVRDFDDSECTCDRDRISRVPDTVNSEPDMNDAGYPDDDDEDEEDERYSSGGNIGATIRVDSARPRDDSNEESLSRSTFRYGLIRRKSDSSILDFKNKSGPELAVGKEGSLSAASSGSFKNICCRIHEDLKEALVKGGKLDLMEGSCKGSWKSAIEAVVKAFFKKKAQRDNGKEASKKLKREKKAAKKEKQVKTIWRRPTPYIYVTDSYGFKVRRPLHPPEYLDKHNYLYLVSYIDRSYISQLARTDF